MNWLELAQLTSTLGKERNDISDDKYLSEPFLLDQSVTFAIYRNDDAAQLHVDACCKEGGSHEEEKRLYKVWSQCPVWSLSMRNRAADVTYELN